MLLVAPAGAQTFNPFAVNFAPTGIAYDPVNQRIAVSGTGGTTIYDTNGVLTGAFGNGGTDLGAGTNGTVWLANGTQAQLRDNNGNGIVAVVISFGTAALGSELRVGTNGYLMYATTDVYALNLDSHTSTALFAVPAGFNVTGGDWCLRSNGTSLADVMVALSLGGAVVIFDGFG